MPHLAPRYSWPYIAKYSLVSILSDKPVRRRLRGYAARVLKYLVYIDMRDVAVRGYRYDAA
jgi:hypothetical protein